MKHIYIFLITILTFAFSLQAKSGGPEASTADRDIAAQKLLQDHSNIVVIYAKGLVCSSCGIGLRIHSSKIDGVDTSKFSKGVLLDSEKQLVAIAFKEGETVDVDAAQQAVYNAGYDPAHYYLPAESGAMVKTLFLEVQE